jgi:hypothetical protein
LFCGIVQVADVEAGADVADDPEGGEVDDDAGAFDDDPHPASVIAANALTPQTTNRTRMCASLSLSLVDTAARTQWFNGDCPRFG